MSRSVPTVVWDIDCYAKCDVAESPDMFRISITPAIMDELAGLRAFFQNTNSSLGAAFPGKAISFLDLPFDGFTAESSEGDDYEGVDRRLEGKAIRFRKDCFYVLADMRIASVALESSKLGYDQLEEKFEQLRSLMLADEIGDAIDSGGPSISEHRTSRGMSL